MKRFKAIIWGRIYLWIFRPLYALEHTYRVSRFVNRDAVSRARRYAWQPSPTRERIRAELEDTGIAITSLEEYFGQGARHMDELRAYMETRATRTNHIKPYITEYFEKIPSIVMDDPFAALALNDETLSLAATYLGMMPKLQEFTLSEIVAVPSGTPKVGSMRWHRDPHDRRLLKMFIYLTDVGVENGPFSYVAYSAPGRKYSDVSAQRPPAGAYAPEGEVERRIDPTDIRVCTGKAGTIIFADTAGLHGGGYVREGHRIMSTAGFLPPKSFLMRHLRYEGSPAVLTPLQHYALLADEHLVSRSLFGVSKRALLGKESFGTYGTYM